MTTAFWYKWLWGPRIFISLANKLTVGPLKEKFKSTEVFMEIKFWTPLIIAHPKLICPNKAEQNQFNNNLKSNTVGNVASIIYQNS